MTPQDFPPRNAFPGTSVNWARHAEDRIKSLESYATGLEQSIAGLNRSTAATLQDMADQLKGFENTLRRLENAGQVYYADSGTVAASVSPGQWFLEPPQVEAMSLSGRFKVGVSASGNDGIAFVGFQTTDHPRSRMVGGSPTASLARASILGAAAAFGSASKEWIVSLEPNVYHVFSTHVLAAGSISSYVQGLSITVQPLL